MSKAFERGVEAGYAARDYCVARGIATELSFYRYREADGTRAEYEAGFWQGVEQCDYDAEFPEVAG